MQAGKTYDGDIHRHNTTHSIVYISEVDMAIAFTDARIVEEIPDTIGGVTYRVQLPKTKAIQALCFRRMRADHSLRCTNVAGHGTDHLGTGACKFHGGSSSAKSIVNGKQAYQTKKRLSNQIQAYLAQDRDTLLDLTEQLAATKAMFDEFLTEFPDPRDDNYGIWLNRFTNIINTLGALAERISKMDTRNTLTTAQVLYLRTVMIDLFVKYIPNPDERLRAVRELAGRMGGDVTADIHMNMSEIPGLGGGNHV